MRLIPVDQQCLVSRNVWALTVGNAVGISAPADTLQVLEFGLGAELFFREAQDLVHCFRLFHLYDPNIN
jgi:hypothetical protein